MGRTGEARLQHVAYMREYNRVYKAAHREELAARQRTYFAAFTPEERKARKRADYLRHREGRLRQQRQHRLDLGVRYLERKASYREANREKLREDARVYYRSHPAQYTASRSARRARVVLAGGVWGPEDWYLLIRAHKFQCFYCGERKPLTADHRVPLARGGSNEIENIVPACRACNGAKHLMTDEEFIAKRKGLLERR